MKVELLLLSVLIALMGCSQSGSTTSLKEHAESNDSVNEENDLKTELVVVEENDRDIPVLLTGTGRKQYGYKLECNEDILGLQKLVEATGYPYVLLNTQRSLNPRDPKVVSSGYKTNPPITCNAKENGNASLIKIPLDGGMKYFVTYGNMEEGKQILQMIGCKALLNAMGFKIEEAAELPAATADIFVNKSDKFDISCISGYPVDYAGVHLKVSQLEQTVVKGEGIQPIELKLENYEGTESPIFLLYENQCEGLKVTGTRLTGAISTDISAQRCTAKILGSAGGKSYGPVAVEFVLQEPEEDKALISGNMTQLVQAKTFMNSVSIQSEKSELSIEIKNKERPNSDDCSWVKNNDGKLSGMAPVSIEGYTCSVTILLNGVVTGQEVKIRVAPYLLDASEYDRVANYRSSKGLCAGRWIYTEYERCNNSVSVYKNCGTFYPETCHRMLFDDKVETIIATVNVNRPIANRIEEATSDCENRYKAGANYADGYDYIDKIEIVNLVDTTHFGGIRIQYTCEVSATKTFNYYDGRCDHREVTYCPKQEQKLNFCDNTVKIANEKYNLKKSDFRPISQGTDVFITSMKVESDQRVFNDYINLQEKCEEKAREMGFPASGTVRYKNVKSWISQCQARGSIGRCTSKTYYKAWECYGDYNRIVSEDFICSSGDHLPQHSADDVNRKFEFIKSAFIKVEAESYNLERENKIRTLMMSLEGVAGSRYSNETIVEYFKDKLKYEPAIRFPELANPFDLTMDVIGFSANNFGRPMANLRWKRTSASSNEWRILGQGYHNVQKSGFSLFGVDSGLVKESGNIRNGYLEMNPYTDFGTKKEILRYMGRAKSDQVEFLVEYELENSTEDYDRILESLVGVVFSRGEQRVLSKSVKISRNTYVIKGRANVEKGETVVFGLIVFPAFEAPDNPSSLKIKRAFFRNVACDSFEQKFYPEFCHKAENPDFLMDAPASGQGVDGVSKISLSKSQIDFGVHDVWGLKAIERDLEISNIGDNNLVIKDFRIEEKQFFVEGVELPLTIKPQKIATIKVSYFPVKSQEVSATLNLIFDSRGVEENPVEIKLMGKATKNSNEISMYVTTMGGMRGNMRDEIDSCSSIHDCEKTEKFCNSQYEAGFSFVAAMEKINDTDFKMICSQFFDMRTELYSLMDKVQCNNPESHFYSNGFNRKSELRLEAYRTFLNLDLTCTPSE